MSPLTETAWLGDTVPPVARGKVGRPAKDHSGRQRKVYCQRCGFIAYASRRALQRAGMPSCGCGESLQIANLRDRAAVEWDALAEELESYGRDAYDAAMRELGYTNMIAPRRSAERHGGRQRRCEASGCEKFTAGRYCPEHEHDRPAMAAARRAA
jgi:hypothetical protein